ncbi:DEAD/DEAH box helicase [Dermatobacter hominis]|uniref:DEAD/DEAH box helicase n=1 Tax=Dermatobacter hominis TaxID=2884263 RepID=UPI001D10A399|nr:DEAD/DEAH box helicase [Dermatobacter hominis]UDY34052.1 DEAD/DEAH box helicase [Dermatobacter hominis]
MNTTFADLGVPAPMVASLAERGIDAPFPIQSLTLADTLAGRDVSGKAPTGSGKTLAFGIPLVMGCPRAEARRPRRLVLVPTRELATQVADELQLLAGRKGPRVAAFFGGVPIPRNQKALERGVDIAVACPGRLADLIQQRMVRLDDVEVVVLDEADRMADMGFLPQVRKLLDLCRDDRQTVLFSATLDGDIDVLVRNYQHDPVLHELEVPEEELPDLEHHFWSVDRTQRVATAAQVVDRMGPTVVFCRTKRGAERVAKQLTSAGVTAAAIHGDRSQNQRDRALEDFRAGRAAALVATDVAARGIHVDDVAAVIHFDPPEDPKDYVHRSGRTARAGARGVVVSLIIPEKASMVKGLQKALDLPRGLTAVDLASLGEPAPRADRPAASPPPDRRSRREATRGHDDGEGSPRREKARNDQRGSRAGARRSGGDARTRDERPRRERDGERRTSARRDESRRGAPRDGERRDERTDERERAARGRADGRRSDGRRSDGRRPEERDRDEAADSPRRRRHRRNHAKDGRRAGGAADGNGRSDRSGARQGGGSSPAGGRPGGSTRASSRGPRR